MLGAPSGEQRDEFRKLWWAVTVSLVGTNVTLLAIPLTAIAMGATAIHIGLLAMVIALPSLLVGVPAGVWVDRLPRRPVLIACDVGRAALLVSIPLAALTGTLTLVQLYVVAFLVYSLTEFFDAAISAYVPVVAGRERLVEANGKLQASSSVAAILFPTVGGFLIQILTAPFAIVFDAVSYLISAVAIRTIRTVETREPAAARRAFISEIRDGMAFVFGHQELRAVATVSALLNVSRMILNAVFLIFLSRELQLSGLAIGVIFTAFGPGYLMSSLFGKRLISRIGLGPSLVAAMGIIGAGAILTAGVSGPVVEAVLVLSVGSFLGGMGIILFTVGSVSLRQALTPTHLQGRTHAFMRVLTVGIMPLGSVALCTHFLGQHACCWQPASSLPKLTSWPN